MVRLAKGALTPSCVDVPAAPAPTPAACAVPSQLATTPSSIPAGRVPSATARLDGGPTLHEAPRVLTAAHTRIPITEETCAMDRAKRSTPTVAPKTSCAPERSVERTSVPSPPPSQTYATIPNRYSVTPFYRNGSRDSINPCSHPPPIKNPSG